jgi:metallo-beta-lactamase family protein
MKIRFLGATETVTGSRTLVEGGGATLLVDCGLFQGLKKLRLRNWAPFPVAPSQIDAVLLTHAHIDHSGYLPALVRNGFSGPIYCTEATAELCRILLPDAAHLQEEEAAYANRRGYSKHKPALPLYTAADAEAALSLLEPIAFNSDVELPGGFRARWGRAGHILGAAWIHLREGDGPSVLFSGDLGRPNQPVIPAPAPPEEADVVILESTYGDRKHEGLDPAEELAGHVAAVAARGGVVVIPAFAVGRAQTLLHLLTLLVEERRIPDIPIFLDSPMASRVTGLLEHFPEEHRLSPADQERIARGVSFTTSVEESKEIDARNGPMVIVSASGMATGGRVLHHLRVFAPDHRNLILFSGFQAAGTRGEAMIHGADTIRMHGQDIPVRAQVAVLDGLSAHADAEELLDWIGKLPTPPARVFLNHGEPVAADALRRRIEERFGWDVTIPEFEEWVEVR